MANITAGMVKELREMTGAAMMDCKRALSECDGDMDASKELLRKKGQSIADKKSSRETKEGAIAISLSDGKSGLVKMACETDFVAINDGFKTFLGEMAENIAEVGADGFTEKTCKRGAIKEIMVSKIATLGENIVFLEGVDWEAAENGKIGGYVHSNGKIGVLVELSADKAVDGDKMVNMAKEISMHIAASQVEAISETELDPAVLEKEKAFLIDQAKESGKPENIIEKMVEGRIRKFKKEICLLDQGFVKSPDVTIAQLLKDFSNELGAQVGVKRFHKASFV